MIRYFIENEKGEWYNTGYGKDMSVICGIYDPEIIAVWTNNPLGAMMFEIKEYAEKYIEYEYSLRTMPDLKVTKHELIHKKIDE